MPINSEFFKKQHLSSENISNQNKLDILIGIVIATFIIAAVFVGYHASQAPQPEAEKHSISLESQITSMSSLQTITVIADQKYNS